MAYITSTKPQKYKVILYKVVNFILGPVGRFLLRQKFHNISVSGTHHLKGGPYLVVMNHSCPLDPVLLTFFGRTPLQFLITEPFMQGSFASKFASAFGQITKRKLDLDPSSIQLMKRWSSFGAHVALFPEGQFSWDGNPSPLMPGLDQLIKYLKLPVVCVHLSNGNYVKPAWATKMRKTSISMTIYPPINIEDGKNIIESIKSHIFASSLNGSAPISSGTNLALGLAKIIRYCPNCEKDESIYDEGNYLVCGSCSIRYEIDATNKIVNSSISSVKDLLDKTYLLLNRLPSARSLGDVSLFDATKKDWVLMETEKLTVNSEGLFLGKFHLKPDEIVDHTLDWGDVIILKTRKNRYTLKLPNDSRLIFDHLIKVIKK